MKNKKRQLITILISLTGLLLQSFTSLFITPRITNILGVEAYGFVSLSRNFITYANIVMVAFNSFAARYVTFSYVKEDEKTFDQYYSSVYYANTLLGGVIVLLSLLASWKLELIINIPNDIQNEVKVLFALTFIGFYLTEVGSVYGLVGYIKDRLDLIQLVKGFSFLAEIITLTFFYFVLKPRVWYMGVAAIIIHGLVYGGNRMLSKNLLPQYTPHIRSVKKSAINALLVNGVWNSINSIGNVLNSGLDLLVSDLLLTATGMGQIAIAKTFAALTSTLNSTVATAFHPSFLRIYSEGRKYELVNEMKSAMKICGLSINVVFGCLVAVGYQFISIWIPNQDTLLIYTLVLLALLPAIVEGPIYPLYYVYTLTLKNRVPCLVTIVGGLANVFGMYVLVRYTGLGIYSILITTAVVMGIINLITNPLYICHCLKINKLSLYPVIIRNLIAAVMGALAARTIINSFPMAQGYPLLVLYGVIAGGVVFVVNAVVLFNMKEMKKMVVSIFMRKT